MQDIDVGYSINITLFLGKLGKFWNSYHLTSFLFSPFYSPSSTSSFFPCSFLIGYDPRLHLTLQLFFIFQRFLRYVRYPFLSSLFFACFYPNFKFISFFNRLHLLSLYHFHNFLVCISFLVSYWFTCYAKHMSG